MILERCVEYDIAHNDDVVWLQANRKFGNMVPELSDDGIANRERGKRLIQRYSDASAIARMKPGNSSFIDLSRMDAVEPVYLTEGIITSNPEHILHANPADCGEIALFGFGTRYEKPVAAILHASRSAIDSRTYIDALEYVAGEYQLPPEDMSVIMSPSAREASYKFGAIAADQLASDLWQNYIRQDEDGMWHVDLHNRTMDDLINFGIKPSTVTALDNDTIADENYYSHYRHKRNEHEPQGGNGLLFALRK